MNIFEKLHNGDLYLPGDERVMGSFKQNVLNVYTILMPPVHRRVKSAMLYLKKCLPKLARAVTSSRRFTLTGAATMSTLASASMQTLI